MRAPSAGDVLKVWDRSLALAPHARPTSLLSLADPDASPAASCDVSVGRRDALLFGLRTSLFGDAIAATTRCGSCGEMLQLDLRSSDLESECSDDVAPRREVMQGYEIDYRVPRLDDVTAIARSEDVDVAEDALLRRCVQARDSSGRAVDPTDLPEPVRATIDDRLSAADSQACVVLRARCATCAADVVETFDIASFLWEEIDTWARRALDDVHMLASAYGWRESDILAMSPQRRDLYVSMVTG